MRAQSLKNKPNAKARENAGDQVVLLRRFTSDWLRE